MWQPSYDRAGYVLLMVMVMLMVLTTALATLATRSLRTTQQASAAVSDLQQKWGIDSCRLALLPMASRIFNDFDRLSGPLLTPNSNSTQVRNFIGDSIELGDQRFDLVVSDENAKVNLNWLYHLAGPKKMNEAVKKLVGPMDARAFEPKPAVPSTFRPRNLLDNAKANRQNSSDEDSESTGDGNLDLSQVALPAFRSWGEVFNLVRFADTEKSEIRLDFAKSMTLWGNGQINVLRSSDQVILTMAEAIVQPATAKKLLKRFRERDADLQTIIDSEVQGAIAKRALSAMYLKNSYSFSLFIDARGTSGQARRLYVLAPDVNGTPEINGYVFH